MMNYLLGVIIALILGLAIGYIIRQKKRGAKCIGCPVSTSCSSSDNKHKKDDMNSGCGCR